MPAARRDLLVPADLPVVVGVDVDEAGCQQIAVGVHHPACLAGSGTGPGNGGDTVAVDDDVALESRRPGAVHDGGVADDQIVHGVPLSLEIPCADRSMAAHLRRRGVQAPLVRIANVPVAMARWRSSPSYRSLASMAVVRPRLTRRVSQRSGPLRQGRR